MNELVEARSIETVTAEIIEAKRVGGEAILTIGKGLIEAKGLLEHGEWLPWLNEKVEFSERTARNFMRLASDWTNRQALADLGATKALTLLALPESERDDFIAQTHEVGGEEKTVVDMTTRELEQAIRERDEARAAAEEAKTAWRGVRKRYDEADKRYTKKLTELEQLKSKFVLVNDERNQLNNDLLRVRSELDELKARPVEVAVQEDEDAKQRIAELEEQLKRAKAEKPSPFAGDDSLIQFKLLFDQAQETVNRMRGLLLKVRGSDADAAERLGRALEALAELVKGAAA